MPTLLRKQFVRMILNLASRETRLVEWADNEQSRLELIQGERLRIHNRRRRLYSFAERHRQLWEEMRNAESEFYGLPVPFPLTPPSPVGTVDG